MQCCSIHLKFLGFICIYLCSEAPALGKFHPITCHEGTEGEWVTSSTLSLTSALDGVGV